MSLILTCEHGGNQVPGEYARWFAGYEALLASHRGWDVGALQTATYFAQHFAAPLFAHEVTRLLVDLNRSETHRALFSEVVRGLDRQTKTQLLDLHHRPFRARTRQSIQAQIELGTVWHLSFHSFTPVLGGKVRSAEIGLLYDPSRPAERMLCHAWRAALRQRMPTVRVRMNYPYRGTADGHTTALRRVWPDPQYAGIELEVNQKLYEQPPRQIKTLLAQLVASFQQALEICRANALKG